MISEKYCSFEVAKKLHEANFGEPTDYYYRNSGVKAPSKSKLTNYCCQCPSLGQAMDWLRTEKGFHIVVYQVVFQKSDSTELYLSYNYTIQVNGVSLKNDLSFSKNSTIMSYEEAAETGILRVLELA